MPCYYDSAFAISAYLVISHLKTCLEQIHCNLLTLFRVTTASSHILVHNQQSLDSNRNCQVWKDVNLLLQLFFKEIVRQRGYRMGISEFGLGEDAERCGVEQAGKERRHFAAKIECFERNVHLRRR